MQQKFVYAHNGIMQWIKGFNFIPERGAKVVSPFFSPDKTYIWRNKVTDGYKIGMAYKDQPMDLSNYLFIRTRERMLLENKVVAPQTVFKSGKPSSLTRDANKKWLIECKKDLAVGLKDLAKIFYVTQGEVDLPVAFATNALYVSERNGGFARDDYERLLLPLLRKKIEYLHSEGVS